MTLEQALNMPSAEYRGWETHFKHHPPGQRQIHYLLALIASATFARGGQHVPIEQIAPWLASGPDAGLTQGQIAMRDAAMEALASGKVAGPSESGTE